MSIIAADPPTVSVTPPTIAPAPKAKAVKVVPAAATVEKEDPNDFIEVHGIRIDILEAAAQVHLSNGTKKLLSFADLSSSLLTFMDKANETTGTVTRYLPTNVYVIEEGPGHLNIGFYFPESIRNVNYLGNIRKSVVPNVILNVMLSRGIGTKKYDYKFRGAKYYSTNLPLSRLSKEMVREQGPGITLLPFTNVYDNADLCMGQNAVLQDFLNNDIRPTSWFYEMLWASPFNNDLGLYALKRDSPFRRDYAAWYAHLAKLASDGKPFPYNELLNM